MVIVVGGCLVGYVNNLRVGYVGGVGCPIYCGLLVVAGFFYLILVLGFLFGCAGYLGYVGGFAFALFGFGVDFVWF